MYTQVLPTRNSNQAPVRWAALLVTVCLVGGGCSSVSPVQTTPPPVEESSAGLPQEEAAEEEIPEASEAATATNSAALLLLAKSETLRAKGQGPQAIGVVERAIRLEPRNGELWVQLGRLNFESGEMARAEQYARRGIALAKTSTKEDSRIKGWLLLADISEARGDMKGAQQIRARWLNSQG